MKVVIAAGGTGGHLFPAEALAARLETRGHSTTLMTDRRTAAHAGERFGSVQVVSGAGLVGKSSVAKARGLIALALGTMAARRTLDADALVAFGGYPSVAPVLAARLRRDRPVIVLHDQNAVLGSANRTLARLADMVATSFSSVAGMPPRTRQRLVGNPVRPAIEAMGSYRAPGPPFELLVLGGSLGARVLSDIVPAAVVSLGLPIRVTQQARAEDVERVRATYAAAGIEAEISPFFADVATKLERAHLVIARSGGSTVAELAASGRPAILVPLPIAANDEQSANARVLVAAGAAWSVAQPDFTGPWLAATLTTLFGDPARLVAAAACARGCGHPHAAESLALLVEELASSHYGATDPIRQDAARIGA